MSRNSPTNELPPTARPDVSQIVKDESARWKAEAAANNWEVLEVPERAQTQNDKLRHAASAYTAQSRQSKTKG